MSIANIIKSKINQLKLPYFSVILNNDSGKLFEYHYCKDFLANGNEKVYTYSLSKPITVVMGLKLLEEGKFDLNDNVYKYLPKYKNAFILDKNGNKILVGEQLKIKHLFLMTAGLSYNVRTNEIKKVILNNENANTEDIVNAFCESPLEFMPGEKFNYSLCHDVLAVIMEKVSGKKFSSLVKEYVFDPLNMKNSSFSLYDNENLLDQYIVKKGEILYKGKEHILFLTNNYESGGAGLISTNNDYALFADCLRNGGLSKDGYRLINENTIKFMYSLKIPDIYIEGTFTAVQGDNYGYGFGVRSRRKPTSYGLPIGEYGWDGALGGYLLVDPVNKVSITMNCNLLNWPVIMDTLHLEIVEILYNEFNLANK